MSDHARRIVAGKYYIITRSCEQQRFHLKPTRAVRGAILYGLLRAISKHPSIRVVGFFFMSNHYHIIVHDSGTAMSACFGLDAKGARAPASIGAALDRPWHDVARVLSAIRLRRAAAEYDSVSAYRAGVVTDAPRPRIQLIVAE